jgi:hypothetical protein
MKLARIDHAIEKCQQFLTQTGAGGSEVEAFLTNYLLILIYATFEEEIKQIIITRAAKVCDPPLESFIHSAFKVVFRSMLTSELAKLLACFGPKYSARFKSRVSGTRAETFFNNIVTDRHQVAHEGARASNITFQDLVEYYENSHRILDELSETISGGWERAIMLRPA